MVPSKRFPQRILLSVPQQAGTEIQYLQQALASNWLSTTGPALERLESVTSQMLGRQTVALASGTAAIHLGLRALGVGPGDRVLTSTLTFVAGVNPIRYLGAEPVFVDCDRSSWNMDPDRLAEALDDLSRADAKPAAIVVTHLFGQTADMDSIMRLAQAQGVPVLEDAAEALGASYRGRPAGSLADLGALSLNGNKIITCSGGGILAGDSERIAQARFWSQQARDPGVDYRHSELGYNYRLSNLLAAVALAQFEVLDERVQRRRAIAFDYQQALADLPGIALMPQADWGHHTNWLSCFTVDRESFGMTARELLAFLDRANIEARPVWKPIHTQPYYSGCRCFGGAVAEWLNENAICLPSSSSLTTAEQGFVVERIREARERALLKR